MQRPKETVKSSNKIVMPETKSDLILTIDNLLEEDSLLGIVSITQRLGAMQARSESDSCYLTQHEKRVRWTRPNLVSKMSEV